MKRPDKLEIGCGRRPTEGYLHQDTAALRGVRLDFTCNPWEIPLKENSLSEVLALAVMEHLRFSEFRSTLTHVYKLLRKRGIFLFDVPDMRVWSEYLYNLTHGQQRKNPFTPKHIWSTIYGWQRWPGDEHKCGWTREELVKLLRKTGFTKIEEGVDMFISRGINRRRFFRPADAHIYVKATK